MPDVGIQQSPTVREAGAWILYDVANTVYAATVTFLLAPYVESQFGVTEALGRTQTISMAAAGIAVPAFAALADKTGRAVRYVTVATLVCIAAMAMFAADLPLFPLMLAFGIANFSYQAGLVFYNALLPSVAKPGKIGLISGLGVGLGYFGTLLTLFALLPLKGSLGTSAAFAVGAAAFLVLALPLMLVVKERRVTRRERFSGPLMRQQFGDVWKTLKGLRHDPPMRRFLIGNFLCVDVLNTAILVFGIYSLRSFDGTRFNLLGFDIDLRTHFELGSGASFHPGHGLFLMIMGGCLNGMALLFGLFTGTLADRWGSLRTLRMSVILLMLALCGGIAFTASTWTSEEYRQVRALVRDADSPSDPRFDAFAKASGATLVAVDPEILANRQEIAEERAKLLTVASSSARSTEPIQVVVFERPAAAPWVPTAFLIAMGLFGSFGLAGIWTAGRKLLIDLAPPDRLGEYFGLYGITTKLSVFGGWVFTALLDTSGGAAAMASQIAIAGLGLCFLYRVRVPKSGIPVA